MKKLMIAIVAVAAAACAQAAAVNWSAAAISAGNGITWNGGKADTKGSGYAAYFFLTESTVGTDTLVSYSDVASKLAAGDFSVLSSAMKTATTTAAGGVSSNTVGTYGVTQADSVKGFMVVFDNATAADAGYFGISAEKSASFAQGTSVNQNMSFTSYTATYGWTQIASVPEPTSGILMLLGMAGLALRRKRA